MDRRAFLLALSATAAGTGLPSLAGAAAPLADRARRVHRSVAVLERSDRVMPSFLCGDDRRRFAARDAT